MSAHKRELDALRPRVKDARVAAALSAAQALLNSLEAKPHRDDARQDSGPRVSPLTIDVYLVGLFAEDSDGGSGSTLACDADLARRFEHLHNRFGRHVRLRIRRLSRDVRRVLETWIGLHLQMIPQVDGSRVLVVPDIVLEWLLADLVRHVGGDAAYSLFVVEPRRVFVHESHHYSYVAMEQLVSEAVRLRKAELIDKAERILSERPPDPPPLPAASHRELLDQFSQAQRRQANHRGRRPVDSAGDIEFAESVDESARWAADVLEQLNGQNPIGLFDLLSFCLRREEPASENILRWRRLGPIANIPAHAKAGLARKIAHELVSVYATSSAQELDPPRLCGSFDLTTRSSIGVVDLSASECDPATFAFRRTVRSAALFVRDDILFSAELRKVDLSTAIQIASLEQLHRSVVLQLATLLDIKELGHCASTSKKFEGQRKKNASCRQVYRGRELLDKVKQASKLLLTAWEAIQSDELESPLEDDGAREAAKKIGYCLEDVLHVLHMQSILQPRARWKALEGAAYQARQHFADTLTSYVESHLSKVLIPEASSGRTEAYEMTELEVGVELIFIKTHDAYDPMISFDVNAVEVVLLDLVPFGRNGRFFKELIETGDNVNLDVVFALSVSHLHGVDVLDPVRVHSLLNPLLDEEASDLFQHARKPAVYASLKRPLATARDRISILVVSTAGSPSYLYDERSRASKPLSVAVESEGLVLAVQSEHAMERTGRADPLFSMVASIIELFTGHDSGNLQFPLYDKLPTIITDQLRRIEVSRWGRSFRETGKQVRRFLDEVQEASLLGNSSSDWERAETLHEEADQLHAWLRKYDTWAEEDNAYYLRSASGMLSKKAKDLLRRARELLEEVAAKVPCAARHRIISETAKIHKETEDGGDRRKPHQKRVEVPSAWTFAGCFLAPTVFLVAWTALEALFDWATGSSLFGSSDARPKLN